MAAGGRRCAFFRPLPEIPLRILLYLGLSIALTWPLGLDPSGQVVGGLRSDLWNSIWGLWFSESHGVLPTTTGLLDHPDGGRIALADPVNALLAQPLLGWLGPVGAYGVLVIAHLAFAGFAADRLGVACGGRGYVAGVGFQLAPITLGCLQSGTSEAFSTGWLPLACLALIRALEGEGWRSQLLAGLALALCALTSWYAGIGAWIFLGAVLGLGWGGRSRGACFRRLAPAMLLALSVTLPSAAVVRGVATADDGLVHIKEDSDLHRIRRTLGAADPRSFVMPGDFRSPDFSELQGNPSDYVHSSYLGFVLLALAIWGLRRGDEPDKSRAWWLAASLGGLLSMGPVLVMDGQPWALNSDGLGLPMPYLLIEDLPGFSSLSLLFRLSILASLGLAILADRARPAWALLVIAEVIWLSPVRDLPEVHVLPDLAGLQAIESEGAVLNLPPDASSTRLFEQTRHGRPLTGALNTGVNATALELLQVASEVREGSRPPEDLARVAEDLSVRWVVLRRTVPLDDPWVGALNALLEHGQVVSQDPDREVIRLQWARDLQAGP